YSASWVAKRAAKRMDTARWRKIEEVYYALMEAPRAERAALLERACGDDLELRGDVESLLSAEDRAGEFLSGEVLQSCISEAAAEPAFPAVGRTIKHYDIVSAIGAGGMGEVYLARDTRLDRQVALKLLPSAFTSQPERVARFIREAKAASALNHPNIITIYETGRTGETWFIAAEFIEGCTVRQKLAGGTLPLPEALEIAIQCAVALETAHRAGIVHRDIKPENIMVRPDGLVKIVDFGLARTIEPGLEGVSQATQAGSIIGPPRYMSPEQARGQKLDARTDIFSLGAVLFEMVEGRPAFPGATAADVFAALLTAADFPAGGRPPARLDEMILKALAKDRENRYRSMEEFENDLRKVDPRREATRLRQAGASLTAPRERQTARKWSRRPVLAGMVLLAVAAAAGYMGTSRHGSAPREAPLNLVPLTTFAGSKDYAAFSPDGSRFAFSWNGGGESQERKLYVKPVGEGEPVQLTFSSSDDVLPAWSPDGRQIAFCRVTKDQDQGRAFSPADVYIVPAAGGAERKIVQGWLGASWSPDGKTLALAHLPNGAMPPAKESGGIFLFSLESGERRELTGVHKDRLPVFSPDGKWIAFTRLLPGRAQEIFVAPTDGGPARQLTFDGEQTTGVTWTADSREVIFSSPRKRAEGRLWRIPVEGGAARSLSAALPSASSPSVSRSGRWLGFTDSWTDHNIYLRTGPGFADGGTPGRFGEPKGVVRSTRADHSPAFSPDAERIAFVSKRSGNEEVWVARQDGRQAVQMTSFKDKSAGSPRWSPDGQRLAFDVWASGESNVYIIDSRGGAPRRLTPEPFESWMPAWSHDGQWIYFTSSRSGNREIWKMPAAGGAATRVTHGGAYEARPSLDGKTVYFSKNDGAVCCAIWSMPAGGGLEEPVRGLENRGPIVRSWGVLKEGIYFLARENAPRQTVRFLSFATHQVTPILTLDKHPGWVFPALEITADGRHMLNVQIDQEVNDLMMIENFR
ncbi:MAG: protein kinase, partial [Bryobacteraceae bacterium]